MREKYTKEELEKINPNYLSLPLRSIKEEDLRSVNWFVDHIEKSRTKSLPKEGDLIMYTDKDGTYFGQGNIAAVGEEHIIVRGIPHVPYVYKEDDGIDVIDTGGTYLLTVPREKMRYIGQEEREFACWGSQGPAEKGAIYFKATVSSWFCSENHTPYTMATSRRMAVIRVIENGHNRFYTGEKEWRSVIDFQAWLETMHGHLHVSDTGVVNVYYAQEERVPCSPEKYEALDLQEDTVYENGYRRCKRKYDEEKNTVYTYFVWYWKEEPLWDFVCYNEKSHNFESNSEKQRKIIESYRLPHNTEENALAKRQILSGEIIPIDVVQYFESREI